LLEGSVEEGDGCDGVGVGGLLCCHVGERTIVRFGRSAYGGSLCCLCA